MGEAAPAGRCRLRRTPARRGVEIAGREALSRRRPLHCRRSDDVERAAQLPLHGHREEGRETGGLCRALHGAAGVQAGARCAAWRFPRRGLRGAMTITITAFEKSPDLGQGLARDTRVRWALEEAGLPYAVRLVSFKAMKEPGHLALHPFGQIPTFEEGELTLFETGAIVLHIAEHHAGLLPSEANARARAIAWIFAALNTVEPPIVDLGMAMLTERDEDWY